MSCQFVVVDRLFLQLLQVGSGRFAVDRWLPSHLFADVRSSVSLSRSWDCLNGSRTAGLLVPWLLWRPSLLLLLVLVWAMEAGLLALNQLAHLGWLVGSELLLLAVGLLYRWCMTGWLVLALVVTIGDWLRLGFLMLPGIAWLLRLVLVVIVLWLEEM